MKMVPDHIHRYSIAHSSEIDAVFNDLEQHTHDHVPMAQMLVGKTEGLLLKTLVASMSATRVLEIGTFTGYSSLMMASALPDHGTLTTCDVDPDCIAVARQFHQQSPHGQKIQIVQGPALKTIAGLEPGFDMVFIDADKTNYLNYFHATLPLLRVGGLIVADNTLWSGRVTEPEDQHEESTAAIHQFNRAVVADPRVECVLLPIRDGMTLIRKLPQ